jgi:hypothetical protein
MTHEFGDLKRCSDCIFPRTKEEFKLGGALDHDQVSIRSKDREKHHRTAAAGQGSCSIPKDVNQHSGCWYALFFRPKYKMATRYVREKKSGIKWANTHFRVRFHDGSAP